MNSTMSMGSSVTVLVDSAAYFMTSVMLMPGSTTMTDLESTDSLLRVRVPGAAAQSTGGREQLPANLHNLHTDSQNIDSSQKEPDRQKQLRLHV